MNAPTPYEALSLDTLRKGGYRITMPRVQVIRALADATLPLSAYAIHEKIIAGGGKIDVVSVYRIISTLQETGLVIHVSDPDGYFPRLKGGNPNESIVIHRVQEGVMEEIESEAIRLAIAAVLPNNGFKLELKV